jgi:carbon-monoxide dehydrogenase medium subunit
MKPAPFEFHRALSTDDAVAALSHGIKDGLDTKVIAGGQSLVALMNMRLARPQVLVDLNEIDELSYIRPGQDALRVGAMTRQRELEFSDEVRNGWPLLSEALPFVAHTPIRSRGTLGGSLAHADPGAELCAVGLALDASVKLHGPRGERTLPLDEFFLGPFTTALEPDEILVEVVFPRTPEVSGWAFEELARRRGDFALAGVAAQVGCGKDGLINHARLAYISMGPKPVRATEAEASLIGEDLNWEAFEAAARATIDGLEPLPDIHAGSEYRSHLARVLTIRALGRAAERIKHLGG